MVLVFLKMYMDSRGERLRSGSNVDVRFFVKFDAWGVFI